MVNVILTHDADSISKPLLHILRNRKRFSFLELISHIFGFLNLYNNFNNIIELEEDVGVKSTFFIPAFLFPLEDIIDYLRSMEKEGWEIGFHAVIEPVQREGLLKMQFDYLRQFLGFEIYGVRAHYLIYDEKILAYYDKLGLKYDSSIRCETVNRWNPYNFENFSLVEFPITIMDADLFGRLHMSEKSAWKYITWKINKAISEGAEFIVLLFHQESFRMKGGRLYSKLLWWLHEHNYELLKCIDAYKIYIKEYLKLNK